MRKLDRPAHDRLDFRRLIDEPEAALRKLCGWLELDFDPRMATVYGEQADSLLVPGELWKAGIRAPVEAQDKFARLFDETERESILQQLTPLDRVLPHPPP